MSVARHLHITLAEYDARIRSLIPHCDQIRRWQALPPERRTGFLRERAGIRRTVR